MANKPSLDDLYQQTNRPSLDDLYTSVNTPTPQDSPTQSPIQSAIKGAGTLFGYATNGVLKSATGQGFDDRMTNMIPASNPQTPIPQMLLQNAGRAALGTVGAGLDMATSPLSLMGGIAAGANRFIAKPLMNMSGANNELKTLGQQYGADSKIAPNYVPRVLTDKLQEARNNSAIDINNLQASLNSNVKNLGTQLFNHDNQIIQQSDNLANTIKSNLPKIYKSTMDNFQSGLDMADDLADKSGFTLSNKKFANDVLNKVIEDSQTSGIHPEKVQPLIDTKNALLGQSKIIGADNDLIGSSMKISDAKSVISNLVKADPYSPLSAKLRETWAGFLENEAPAEVKPIYEQINSQYKPFAEARTLLGKLSNSNTGEFDASGLSKFIASNLKGKGDTGITKLMGLLGDGNGLVPASNDIKSMYSQISPMKDARANLLGTLKNAQSSIPDTINAAKQANFSKIGKILQDRSRANQLANIADESAAKINPIRAVGKAVLGKGRIL